MEQSGDLHEEAGSSAAPITAPDHSSVEPQNPGTASNPIPANSDGQQSPADAAPDQSDNQPQNLALNGGTAAGFESPRRPTPTELSYRSHPSSIELHEEYDGEGRRQQSIDSLAAPVTAPDHSSVEPPNPGTPSNPTPANSDGQQSPSGAGAAAAAGQPDNQPQNAVLNGGTAAGYMDARSSADGEARRQQSISEMTTKKKREIKPDDLLAKTLLDRLDILERICRCLDKDYKYGRSHNWKHIAEHFGIDEETYQNFKCSKIHSPTEAMFEYLQTNYAGYTVEELKKKLSSIERQDVINVLVECEPTDCSVNDGALVCSLFDSKPDIIGRIAILLDRQKVGLKNWVQLAIKLDIPKNVYKSFETCSTNNPTENLLEYLKIHFPRLTVEELITHLEAMQRSDVVKAIEESTEVDSGSLIKDLMGDLLVMDNVCELLNRKPSTFKMQYWKHLGRRFKIDQGILDDLSPQQDFEYPTEALIRHLGSRKPDLTIADFIRALDEINRPDVIDILQDYLPVGCVSELMRS